jgi:hypothetical protein
MRDVQSRALRFLVFAGEADPDSLQVEITMDGIAHPYPAQYKGKGDPNGIAEGYMPLWISEWDPQNFNDMEEHVLRITVTDSHGRKGVDESIFKVNGARIDINGGAGEWIIWTKFSFSVSMIHLSTPVHDSDILNFSIWCDIAEIMLYNGYLIHFGHLADT